LLASTVESAFARTRRERQLAQRNERLNDFASVVSHDLRNPLNVASAHAELARDADDPDSHLAKIDDSLRRMEALIEDPEPTDAEIEAAVGTLRESGSIEFARETATDLIEQGKSRLEVLPDNEARDLLEEIADYLIEREY